MKTIKKIVFLISIICLGINYANADDLTIQLTSEIDFSDGFGVIQAKPVLKGVKKQIQAIGEYNVDEKSRNVTMKIDKISIDSQMYSLTEPFSVKRRLKNLKNAKLKSGSKIKLTQGNKAEILAILNGESQNGTNSQGGNSYATGSGGLGSGTSTDGARNGSYSSYGTTPSSYGSGSGLNSLNPYMLGGLTSGITPTSTTKPDYSSPTTNADGSCRTGEISEDFAYVYVLNANGQCIKKATTINNVFKKTNTTTCPNKIDYNQNLVSIGEEAYAIIDDTEYRVQQCKYGDMLELKNEVGTCNAIPDYKAKTAQIQKQFYYIHNNERIDVGGCKPTEQIVNIYDDDYNDCEYTYDFDNFKAIKQTQWYYHLQNNKNLLGECVNVDETKIDRMTYPMRESVEDCECNEFDGVKNCQTKLVFNGFGNEKIQATECRYVDTTGVTLIDEFAGYSFKDQSSQAVKKINQYFIGTGGEKIYVTKDKETNKVYPYKSKSCGWEHKPDLKISYHKAQVVIEDKDEDIENIKKFANVDADTGDVIVKSCDTQIDITLYWQQELGNVVGALTNTHNRKTIIPEGQSETTNTYYIRELEEGKAKLESGQGIIVANNFKANSGTLKDDYCGRRSSDGGCSYFGNIFYNNLSLTNGNPNSITIGNGYNLLGYHLYATYTKNTNVRVYRQINSSTPSISSCDNKTIHQSPDYNNGGYITYYCVNGLCNDDTLINYNKTTTCPITQNYQKEYFQANNFRDSQEVEKSRLACEDAKSKLDPNTYSKAYCQAYNQWGALNNPLRSTDGSVTNVYEKTLEQPYEYYADSVTLNTNDYNGTLPDGMTNDELIQISEKTIDVIDTDTGKCKKHEGQDTNSTAPDYNALAGQCQQRIVKEYTLGYEYIPTFEKAENNFPNFCKVGETQIPVIEIAQWYELPETTEQDVLWDGTSHYLKYIDKNKADALNPQHYKKIIKKVECKSGVDTIANNARIVGSIINLRNSIKFTALEADSLVSQINFSTWGEHSRVKCGWRGLGRCGYQESWRKVSYSYSTKRNWGNNQTIYEYKMYRRYKRPDGTIFDLYERQGYFTTRQDVETIYDK